MRRRERRAARPRSRRWPKRRTSGGLYQPRIGETLARRQQGQDPRTIQIAWRAQHRLHQRWAHLPDQRRKPAGVVAIACARELAAFCWEAATLD